MKNVLTAWILVLFAITISAQEGSLNKKYTLKIDAESSYQALLDLGKRINYNFVYDASLIGDQDPVKINARKLTLDEILSEILPVNYNGYEIIGSQVILLPPSNHQKIEINTRVSGFVVDHQNNNPVEFATISLKSLGKGTISNIDGQYSLHIDSVNYSDTVQIGALGYNYKEIPVLDLIGQQNIIRLKAKIIPIQEVYVREQNPRLLTKQCIENSDKIYLIENTISDAFYREYIVKNEAVQSFYEASLKYFQPHSHNSACKVIINKALKGYDIRYKDTVAVKMQGGLYSMSFLDIINSKPAFFDIETMDQYHYTFKDIVTFYDRNLYVVGFTPKNFNIPMYYQGMLYIDVENLILVKADVSIVNTRSSSLFDVVNKSRNRKLKSKITKTNYIIQYKPTADSLYLQHLRFEIFLKIRNQKSLFNSNYQLVSEILLDNWTPSSLNGFSRKEIENSREVFTEIIQKYRANYWGDYNFIPTDNIIDQVQLSEE